MAKKTPQRRRPTGHQNVLRRGAANIWRKAQSEFKGQIRPELLEPGAGDQELLPEVRRWSALWAIARTWARSH